MRSSVPALVLSLLAASSDAVAGCGAADPRAALERALTQAEATFAGADAAAFHEAVDDAAAWLVCQETVLDPGLAARYHRVRAMWAYAQAAPDLTEEERLSIQRITAAACAADPTGRFPEAAVEPDEDLAKWLSIDLACRQVAHPPFPRPAAGALWRDGVEVQEWAAPGATATLRWPAVLQRVAPGGALESTAWLPSDTVVPASPLPVAPGRRGSGPQVLVGLGAAAVVAGAVTMAVAGPATAAIVDGDWTGSEEVRRSTRAQYYYAGGAALGVGAALLTGGAVWLSASRDGAQGGVALRLP